MSYEKRSIVAGTVLFIISVVVYYYGFYALEHFSKTDQVFYALFGYVLLCVVGTTLLFTSFMYLSQGTKKYRMSRKPLTKYWEELYVFVFSPIERWVNKDKP